MDNTKLQLGNIVESSMYYDYNEWFDIADSFPNRNTPEWVLSTVLTLSVDGIIHTEPFSSEIDDAFLIRHRRIFVEKDLVKTLFDIHDSTNKIVWLNANIKLVFSDSNDCYFCWENFILPIEFIDEIQNLYKILTKKSLCLSKSIYF